MRVLIAPQEFKGSLSATEAAQAMAEGLRSAASEAGLQTEAYRTDHGFIADLSDLREKMHGQEVAVVVVASLFGVQNNGRALLEELRKVDKDTFIILDECQNLTPQSDIEPDSRTLIVFSFNTKNIPGIMGGGICWRKSAIDIDAPPRSFRADCCLGTQLCAAFALQVVRRLKGVLAGLRKRRRFAAPEREYSVCTRLLYDVRPQRIAKISLVRSILGMLCFRRLERVRKKNFARLEEFLEISNTGVIAKTERADVAPFIPLKQVDAKLHGRLPLKGPYASECDPANSLRPEVLCFRNDGVSSWTFDAERHKLA
ncbi:hypothetical protein LCGC14_2191380 [marine sediment metagenome]|uniref:Uncharacterized protein n=1 Tax=marine sediment metagenome TaxID=412755 RepID=A0A0F9DJM8_9ZZZZ